jgi:hypothetical protein
MAMGRRGDGAKRSEIKELPATKSQPHEDVLLIYIDTK